MSNSLRHTSSLSYFPSITIFVFVPPLPSSYSSNHLNLQHLYKHSPIDVPSLTFITLTHLILMLHVNLFFPQSLPIILHTIDYTILFTRLYLYGFRHGASGYPTSEYFHNSKYTKPNDKRKFKFS